MRDSSPGVELNTNFSGGTFKETMRQNINVCIATSIRDACQVNTLLENFGIKSVQCGDLGDTYYN